MDAIKHWKETLTPDLSNIAGVNSVDNSKTGIVINLEYNTPSIQDAIMAVFEKAGADDIPYKTKVIGRVVKLTV